jgi:hypothetical protein
MSYYRCMFCRKTFESSGGMRRHYRNEHADELVTDHAYLSAGDTPYAKGDVCYSGCFICNKSSWLHERR